ncbi:phage antirepressor KilAC domain-containing protein [Pleionea sp. CnH1-48]|uniref:phage antirepressor KilAC domain-containing protein n=1 Tax=Pleionea sp. CnH1-48 TaxID=2954494 RepID=UPI002096F9AE|nr:phage antirepressor KilAC domain-containing protein [Pleionea sp. CnH1-48]MCO7227567.1 phage antirepressor KilAC domain-containing protein [Pleionea sp. CnH1-48]
MEQKQYPMIAGVEITTDKEGRYNLNALHRASGGARHKAPAQWLRQQQAQDIVHEVTRMLINILPIQVNNGGVNPGTFAHEIIAVSYAAWISPAFQVQVNQTFLDYKNGKLTPVEQTPTLNVTELLRLGYEAAQRCEVLELKVEEDQPKVEAYDQLLECENTLSITEAAKKLGIRPNKDLRDWMYEHNWIYQNPKTKEKFAYQDKINEGLLVHTSFAQCHAYGYSVRNQVRITARGLAKLTEKGIKNGDVKAKKLRKSLAFH